MTKLVQRGLTSKDEAAMNVFADRVDEYNKSKGFVVVELDAREQSNGMWDLELSFLSRAYAKDFWYDPKYQAKILMLGDNDA